MGLKGILEFPKNPMNSLTRSKVIIEDIGGQRVPRNSWKVSKSNRGHRQPKVTLGSLKGSNGAKSKMMGTMGSLRVLCGPRKSRKTKVILDGLRG